MEKKEINLLEEQLPLPGFAPSEREQKHFMKKIIEALLFATAEPLSFQKIREILETKMTLKPKILKDALEDLQDEYIHQQRSFRLEETAEGFLLKTCEEYSPFIQQLFRDKRQEKITNAQAEVLAIIAYKQPITKPAIDAVRGVDSSGTLQILLERELVQSLGKQEAPGRPTLYGITPHFLLHFGLKDLSELNSNAQ